MSELHEEPSHPSEATTQATGDAINFTMGKFQQYEDYTMGKAKQSNVRKLNGLRLMVRDYYY